MRLRAFPPISAGLLAAALAFASLPAAAEDKPMDPCFDGTLTVKEVLDACEAFIAKGNDDKKLLIRAHSVRTSAKLPCTTSPKLRASPSSPPSATMRVP